MRNGYSSSSETHPLVAILSDMDRMGYPLLFRTNSIRRTRSFIFHCRYSVPDLWVRNRTFSYPSNGNDVQPNPLDSSLTGEFRKDVFIFNRRENDQCDGGKPEFPGVFGSLLL